MRNVSGKFVENIILCSITCFPESIRLWDYVEKCCRTGEATDDNITRRILFACSIPKSTNTLRICNTYWYPTATMDTRTSLNITLHVRCLSCPNLSHFRRICFFRHSTATSV